LFEGLIEDLKK